MESLANVLNKEQLTWKKGNEYPSWVDLSEAGLDQFYTHPDTARQCYNRLLSFLISKGIDMKDILFIEPAAGTGVFSSLLPVDSIALDLAPARENIEKQDFMTWDIEQDKRIMNAKADNKTIVAIGNPPFGTRGWMALAFLNKCADFCDYCAFLLPMSFASEGKGSPKYRVNGMRNIISEELLKEVFETPDGKARKLNVVWQIWEQGENCRETFDYVDANFIIKCIGDFSYRLCGQDFKQEADVFISQGYFPGTPMSISQNWDDILYGSGYGVKALNGNVDEMIAALTNADWSKYSTASTHGCRHIGITEIKKVLSCALAPEELAKQPQ